MAASGFRPALAGAALAIALLAFAWNAWQTLQLNQQLATQREFMVVIAYAQGNVHIVRGTDLAPEAVGRLFADPDAKVAALVTVDMPASVPIAAGATSATFTVSTQKVYYDRTVTLPASYSGVNKTATQAMTRR